MLHAWGNNRRMVGDRVRPYTILSPNAPYYRPFHRIIAHVASDAVHGDERGPAERVLCDGEQVGRVVGDGVRSRPIDEDVLDELSVGREQRHAIVATVAHEDVVGAVDAHSLRPQQLSVAGSPAAALQQ